MGRDVPIEFGTQSNPGRHGQDGSARFINAYSEFAGEEGKTAFPIYSIEGLTRLVNESTSSGIRGMLTVNNDIYAVGGQQIFKVDVNGTVTQLGGMPGIGTVYMARNQNAIAAQIALVHNGTHKVIQSDTLTTLSDPDLPPANSVTAMAGYFIFTIPDGRWFITGANDITVNALDFAQAEQFPDGLLRGLSANGVLWLFGMESTEMFAFTGNADFPFQLLPGGAIEYGIISGATAAGIAQSVLWVDHNGVVRQAQGRSAIRVSHHAVERSIESEANPSLITGMAYTYRGHHFYIISGSGFTWAYDINTGKWHERRSFEQNRWRGEHYTKVGEKHYVGDSSLGRIYQIDKDVHSEDGNPILWEVTGPLIHAGNKRLSHSLLDMDVLTGVGLNSTTSSELDPVIELRYSDDGGETYSTWRSAALGRLGKKSTKIRFKRLGQASRQGRSYSVRSSAAVARGLMGATLRIR